MPFWLPLGAAGLLVLAIYLIRPTAQTLPVASTVLWRRLLAVRKRRRDLLRWLLSLFLATAVAGVLSVAAARAPWLQPGGGDPIALAFDPSATMRARLPASDFSRLDLAAAEARRIVLEAEPGSRFTLNDDPVPLTANEMLAALAEPLERLLAADDDPEQAIPAARRVYVFSDGVGPYAPVIDPAAETRTVSVLVPARNAGIVRFATRTPPTRTAAPEALLEIVATDPAAAPVPAELTVADAETIRIRRQLELEPGRRFTALIDLGSFSPGSVTARIEASGDVFPLDDRAGLIDVRGTGGESAAPPPLSPGRQPGAPRRVVVTARSPESLAGSAAALALEADAAVELVAVRAGDAAPEAAAEPAAAAELAVFHRTAPALPPELPALYLDPPDTVAAGGLLPAVDAPQPGRRIDQGRIDRVQADHPLLAGVLLLDLPVVVTARGLDPGCFAIAAAGGRPAIAVCDPAPADGQRSIAIAFDVDLSPLAQRPDLAALFQNAVEWLTERPADAGWTAVDAGLQNERATRINDSALTPVSTDRLADVERTRRSPWSWRTLAVAGLLLAALEAVTFFRGLTL